MQRWHNGDELAFDELYRKYFDKLLRTAYNKIRIFNTAEEMVQDVFLGFYNRKEIIKDEPLAYLRGILNHKLLDYFRNNKESIFIPAGEEMIFNVPAGNNTQEAIAAKETSVKLRTLINGMPEQRRKVFLMSREEDLTNREIAERLGISLKAVEAHITKALKYLRENMDCHWAWWIMVGYALFY